MNFKLPIKAGLSALLISLASASCLIDPTFAQTATVSRSEVVPTGYSLKSGMNNAAATNYYPNDGKTLFVISNSSSTPVTATAVTQQSSLGREGYSRVSLTDLTIPVPSYTTVIAGPFPTTQWNTPQGTGRVNLSGTAGVSVTAIKLP